MGNSWGHTLERLTDEEIAKRIHDKACDCGCRRRRLCTSGRRDHEAPATYLATYNYVTGRAGRVSWASKYVCDDHAAKFAAKHGIRLGQRPGAGRAAEACAGAARERQQHPAPGVRGHGGREQVAPSLGGPQG